MPLGAHVPPELWLPCKGDFIFQKGEDDHPISRFVGAEIEFHDFQKRPEDSQIRAIQEAVAKWGGSIVEDHHNAEVQLSPAKGHTFIKQAKEVCATLNAANAKVTDISGLHIHVDCRDMKFRHLGRVMAMYSKYEPIIIQTQPYARIAGRFCRPSGPDLAYGWLKMRSEVDRSALFKKKADQLVNGIAVARYKAVNFASWYKYKTMEVRCHEGTLDADEMARWAAFWCSFVDAAKDLKAKEIVDIPATKTMLFDLVAPIGADYVQERLNKYKGEWTDAKLKRVIPPAVEGKACQYKDCGRESTILCCNRTWCRYHYPYHH
jgi:putative amidoligase enzyme